MARSPSESRTHSPPRSPSGTGPVDVDQRATLPGAQAAPRDEFRAASPALWVAAFALGACALVASLLAAALAGTGSSHLAATAGAVVALLMLLALAVLRKRYGAAEAAAAERGWRTTEIEQRMAERERQCGEREALVTGRLAALAEIVDHLVSVQLPAAFNGSPIPPPPVPVSASASDHETSALCGRIVSAAATGAAKLRERVDDSIESSRLAAVTLARRVQASAHRIQEEATRMAQRHPADTDVLESSMRVDHAAAQQARHAQSIAVLCGEWPGQQWPQPLALVDVVRAASSRIVPYQRVAVSGEPDTAATAGLVEPLIHLVAELLANATQSSPPATQVLVTVRTVQRGAVIEIDDGGVGMEEHRLDEARQIISGQKPVGLNELGEIPQTGLAVVGQYARRYELRVDLMPSPYGGIRAVVLVPAEMVETLEVPAPVPQLVEAEAEPTEQAGIPAAAGVSSGSLPQRRSRRGEAGSPGSHPSPEVPAAAPPTPEQAGEWMAAFFSGSADEAATAGQPAPPSDQQDMTADPPDGQPQPAPPISSDGLSAG